MEYVYLSAIIGLSFFNFFAYRRGLNDGLALKQGKPIEPIPSPVQVFQQHVDQRAEKKETKTANDHISDGLANIMAYDGSAQKVVKDE